MHGKRKQEWWYRQLTAPVSVTHYQSDRIASLTDRTTGASEWSKFRHTFNLQPVGPWAVSPRPSWTFSTGRQAVQQSVPRPSSLRCPAFTRMIHTSTGPCWLCQMNGLQTISADSTTASHLAIANYRQTIQSFIFIPQVIAQNRTLAIPLVQGWV